MILKEDNFYLYAAKYYDNNDCSSFEEFEEDLQRFKYLRKLFFNYRNKDILKERLILNHIVILYNIFEPFHCTKMLIFKFEDYLDILLPFLDILGYLPTLPVNIKKEGFYIDTTKIQKDILIEKKLKEVIKNG